MAPPVQIINAHPRIAVAENTARQLAEAVIAELDLPIVALNIIFDSDAHVRELHARYLNDDTVTDIITFNLGTDQEIEGELYISIDRAAAHAGEFEVALENELSRLVIHGLLHLGGYQDHNDEMQQRMRARENRFLDQYSGILTLTSAE